MPWSAQVRSRTETATGYEVGAVLTDGVSQKFEQKFQTNGTRAHLKSLIQQRTAVADELRAKPEIEVGDVIDLTPDPVREPDPVPEPIPPTKEEIARTAFFADVATERRAAKVAALSPELQARCLPEYVDAL